MGPEGSSSCSGALDVMVKSDAKKSIVVYVVWGLSTMRCEKCPRMLNPLLLYIKFLWKGTPRKAITGMDEDNIIITIGGIGPMANVRPVVAFARGSY